MDILGIIEKMLAGTDVRLNCDYFNNKTELDNMAEKIIFTGPIDQYYNYCFGELEYRSMKFEMETINATNYQGNAVVNYTEFEIPYTKIIEHKYFEYGKQSKTVISREYPIKWEKGKDAYYPINDKKNNELYNKYKELSKKDKKVIFCGRLGEYRYYDMDNVIEAALKVVENELK